MSLPQECLEYIRLFNEKKFFEAHEVLEALWLKEKGEARQFYQGMIQIAAVYVHIQKKNEKGSKLMFEKARANLTLYLPQYRNLDLKQTLSDVEQSIQTQNTDYYLTWPE